MLEIWWMRTTTDCLPRVPEGGHEASVKRVLAFGSAK